MNSKMQRKVLVMQARKKRYKAAKARMKPDDSKTKPKSGSVSSFNDEDYEVGENSDDEEQEDPGDYVKGTLCGVACKELLLQLRRLFEIHAQQ